ncbi:MAG TPA: MYXO-CTERM sorting domain-containing protein [Nevskiaceae bacterium]|nr:MYXO-CTERM sorting domain-containing protein [Nevskiaceae bacterium]
MLRTSADVERCSTQGGKMGFDPLLLLALLGFRRKRRRKPATG